MNSKKGEILQPGDHFLNRFTTPNPMSTKKEKLKVENRQEGVFYGEEFENDCCDECHDVTFEKTYPAHTAYHACMNLKCHCHSQSESIEWEERIKTQIEYLGESGMNTVSFRKCVFEAIRAIFQEAITTAVAKDRNDCPCVKFKISHPGNVECRRCDIEKVIQKAVLNRLESEVNIAVAKREKELVEEVRKFRLDAEMDKPPMTLSRSEADFNQGIYESRLATIDDILSILKH